MLFQPLDEVLHSQHLFPSVLHLLPHHRHLPRLPHLHHLRLRLRHRRLPLLQVRSSRRETRKFFRFDFCLQNELEALISMRFQSNVERCVDKSFWSLFELRAVSSCTLTKEYRWKLRSTMIRLRKKKHNKIFRFRTKPLVSLLWIFFVFDFNSSWAFDKHVVKS